MSTNLAQLLDVLANLERADDIAPYAFFDADHTLWATDLADVCVRRAVEEGAFRAESADALAAMMTDSGGEPTGDPNKDAMGVYHRYLEGHVSEVTILAAQVICWAGWTTDEATAFGRKMFEEVVAPRVYEGMEQIHETLRGAGIELRIISGTAHWLVVGAASAMGIEADHVRGALGEVSDGVIQPRVIEPLTYREGKLVAVESWIGDKRAAVSFGDSGSDLPMLDRSATRVAVNPRPGVRTHAADNDPHRWHLWIPDRMRSGEPVEPLTTDRIVV